MSATQGCSRCGTPLPVADGYVTWCHECGWNLRPVEQDGTAQGRLHRLYDAAGRRVGNRMASRLRSADRLLPSWTPAKVAAHGIAFGVYGFTAALFAGGLWLAAGAFPNPAALVAAALMLGVAILMRPRFGRPSAEGAVDRSSAPRLLALIDEVASALGTPPVHIVQIDEEYNASWAVVGLRRRRVLRLGLPLLAVLDPQERVAVIAHELAHGRNGDARRGFFVGSAVRGLGELYGVVRPEGRIDYDSYFGIFERIVNVILYVVSRPAMWLLLVELHLL
ncbi:MAG: M48 family metalloprotease, partial [Actinobacteria bacterium]|nr:M48 family metalloprotease [Actinomycetota bacterium]